MPDGKRPLTYEDFWEFKIVDDVQLSPDGSRAAYVVTTVHRETDTERSSVWMVDLDTCETEQFTAGTKRDWQPRWSPDGEWLALVSTRDGDTSQIYVMWAHGGEALKLTDRVEGADTPVWSPDSRRLAFLAKVRSERQSTASEIAFVEEKRDERRDKTQLRRLTDPKYRFDGRGYVDTRSQIFVIDREGGETRQLTEGDFDNLEPAWSPDGSTIAFVSNRTPDRNFNFASDIWSIEVETGEVTQLNRTSLTATSPSWSPDGRVVAFYATPEWIANGTCNQHVWTVPRQGGEARDLIPDFDRTHGALLGDYGAASNQAPVWSPDGTSLYFTASDHGREVVCRVRFADGTTEILTSGDVDVAGVQVTPDGTGLLCCASTPTQPFDVFRLSAASGDLERVVDTNGALLERVHIFEPRRLQYTSVDDWEVEGWLIRPEDGLAPCPMVLLVHGGPHGMYGTTFYFNMQVLAGAGVACLYINPRGSAGYGLDFMRAVCGEWGGKDFADLMRGVDVALEGGEIDTGRLAITGGSYGGFMTNWALGHSDRFACGVAVNGISNLVSFWGTSDIGALWCEQQIGGPFWKQRERYERLSPLSYVTEVTAPLLLIHAEKDHRVPIEQSEQMFMALKMLRRDVEMVRVPEASHSLAVAPAPRHRIDRWQLAKLWFDRYLRSDPFSNGE